MRLVEKRREREREREGKRERSPGIDSAGRVKSSRELTLHVVQSARGSFSN